MNYEKNNSSLIAIAARLVKCDVLSDMDELCETQKTISTSKLREMLDNASNTLKNEAVLIGNEAHKQANQLKGL